MDTTSILIVNILLSCPCQTPEPLTNYGTARKLLRENTDINKPSLSSHSHLFWKFFLPLSISRAFVNPFVFDRTFFVPAPPPFPLAPLPLCFSQEMSL